MRKPKSFEEGMDRMEQLLQKLSSPETPLDEAVKLYSEAAGLMEYCTTTLENAKLKMQQIDLQSDDADKKTEETPQ